jgi:hypothetical protein
MIVAILPRHYSGRQWGEVITTPVTDEPSTAYNGEAGMAWHEVVMTKSAIPET